MYLVVYFLLWNINSASSESHCGSYTNLTNPALRTDNNDLTLVQIPLGWYRYTGTDAGIMATSCPNGNIECGAKQLVWIQGVFPVLSNGSVTVDACIKTLYPNGTANCCGQKSQLPIENCGLFFIYLFVSIRPEINVCFNNTALKLTTTSTTTSTTSTTTPTTTTTTPTPTTTTTTPTPTTTTTTPTTTTTTPTPTTTTTTPTTTTTAPTTTTTTPATTTTAPTAKTTAPATTTTTPTTSTTAPTTTTTTPTATTTTPTPTPTTTTTTPTSTTTTTTPTPTPKTTTTASTATPTSSTKSSTLTPNTSSPTTTTSKTTPRTATTTRTSTSTPTPTTTTSTPNLRITELLTPSSNTTLSTTNEQRSVTPGITAMTNANLNVNVSGESGYKTVLGAYIGGAVILTVIAIVLLFIGIRKYITSRQERDNNFDANAHQDERNVESNYQEVSGILKSSDNMIPLRRFNPRSLYESSCASSQ